MRISYSLAILTILYSTTLSIDVDQIIKQAQNNAINELEEGSFWNFPTYLGTMFISEYYFQLLALNYKETQFDVEYFRKILLDQQRPDGSWDQVLDGYTSTGLLDATVANYWFLKTIGEKNLTVLELAKQNILSKGGIEACQTMTKFKLATFGKYPWKKLFNIPLWVLNNFYFLDIKDVVAQWVYPHLLPLVYLRNQQTIFNIGADLSELYLEKVEIDDSWVERPQHPPQGIINVIERIFSVRQPRGSIGAYTVSTVLSLLVFKDFQEKWPQYYSQDIKISTKQAFEFIEMMHFNRRQKYQGSLDDGRWWDTILISWAMLESNFEKEKLIPVMDRVIKDAVQPGKGVAYGWEFEYAPDIDDTGLLIGVLGYFGDKYKKDIDQMVQWVFEMQNKDGGFAAFDKDKQGNRFIYWIFEYSGVADSAEIFDPSCADITGHILEGLAAANITLDNGNVQRAIEYLKNTQNEDGTWQGRWGINYIYSSGAVISGLSRIKYDLKEKWIQKNIQWLITCQNKDGGFGETTLSYNDASKYKGKGISTVSQTSWALLALLEVYDIYDVKDCVERAVQYLKDNFVDNKFSDMSVVGTGHRGMIYLQYPSYAYSFPLIALSKYQKIT